jgi:hypothetical protein
VPGPSFPNPGTYSSTNSAPPGPDLRRLLPYVANPELEVDRLRRQNRLVPQEVRGTLDHLRQGCAGTEEANGAPAPRDAIVQAADPLAVDSGEGQGTTVMVVLPRFKREAFLL